METFLTKPQMSFDEKLLKNFDCNHSFSKYEFKNPRRTICSSHRHCSQKSVYCERHHYKLSPCIGPRCILYPRCLHQDIIESPNQTYWHPHIVSLEVNTQTGSRRALMLGFYVDTGIMIVKEYVYSGICNFVICCRDEQVWWETVPARKGTVAINFTLRRNTTQQNLFVSTTYYYEVKNTTWLS